MLIRPGQSLIRLAFNNETTASYDFPVTYDLACFALSGVLARSGGIHGIVGNGNPHALESLAKFTNLTAMGGGAGVGY